MNRAGREYSVTESLIKGTTKRFLDPIAAKIAPNTGVTVNPKYCAALIE